IHESPLFTHESAPMISDGNRVYLQRYWAEETRVLEAFQRHLAGEKTKVPEQVLNSYFAAEGSPEQWREAVRVATREPLSLITGWPGSGKTTVLSRILGVLFDLDPNTSIALAAPTGKAAARM